jgi:hypothetical protein
MNGTCSGSSCVLDSGNSTVQFTPSPAGNFRFDGWTGCTGYLQGAGTSIIFSNPTAAKSCTANFVEVVTIETGVSGAGGGSITVSNLSGGTCSGTACQFDSGTGAVTFTPVPQQGYRFLKWSGSLCSGYTAGQGDDIFWFKPTASAKCVANFVPAVTIRVSDIVGSGSVVVSFVSNGTCDGATFPTCLLTSGAGTVTFRPIPTPNSQFQKWLNCTGYTVANDGSATFTNPTTNQTCVAAFSP